MNKPTSKSYVPPVVETSAERIEEQMLQTEVQAELADEREVLEEMHRKAKEAEDALAEIRASIERIKQGE